MGAAVARASALALAGAAAAAWLGLIGFTWNDYEYTAVVPVGALVSGDLGTFLRDAPVDGPSLLLRAPFAFAPGLWGGGELAVYRALAVPALLAAVVLAVGLAVLRRRAGITGWAPLLVLLVAANPLAVRALEMGHAEELLGAALAVGALLAARAQRPWAATLLLGLAMGNKAWAVLALGPVLLALDRHRLRTLLVSGAVAAVFVVPFLLATAGPLAPAGGGGSAIVSVKATGTNMQPWQLWWGLGAPADDVVGYDGLVKPDWRTAPAWLGTTAHGLIVLLAVPLSLVFARRRRHGDVLALLALLFALRCLLDPVDNGYYHLPLVFALAAWEAGRRGPPVALLVGTVLIWVTFQRLPSTLAPDLQHLSYVAWAVPGTVWLAAQAFGVGLSRRRAASAGLVPVAG